MFVSDELRQRAVDYFVVLRSTQTLRDALNAFKAQDAQEYWYLIVEMPDGSYLAAKYGALRTHLKEEGEALLDRPLADFENAPLQPTHTIPHDATPHPDELPGLTLITWMGAPVAVIDNLRRRHAPVREESLLVLAGMESKTPLGGIWDEPAPASPPEQSMEVHGNVEGSVNVAGGHIIQGDFVQQVYVINEQQQKRQLVEEQYRVFETAFPEKSIVDEVAMLGVAVYLPGLPSPFKPDEEPRQVTRSDQVAVQLPVDEESGKLQPIDVEITVTAGEFRVVGGQSTKTLTIWPDGKPAVRWFQLEPREAGSQIIQVELTFDNRLLQEIQLVVNVEGAQTGVVAALTQALSITRVPLQFNFAR
ncbi:MAG: hypothetical protein ACFB51_04485 [Anaerolineae bacterium]